MARKTRLIFTLFLILLSLLILVLNPPLLTANYTLTSINESTVTSKLVSTSLSSVPNLFATANQNRSATFTENGSSFAAGVDSIPPRSQMGNEIGVIGEKSGSCDIFDGKWVVDDSDPVYPPGSCPYLDYAFNCFNNGRLDLDYLRYRWHPYGCDIPRFDGVKMLEMLKGKRMVFVGDSLNRNMWQSLVCSLRMSLVDKNRISEVSERRQFRKEGSYAYEFQDYNCTIEFIRAPFLVQQWKNPTSFEGVESRRETLRLDMMQSSTSKYNNADFLVFNTGHWWTYHKTQNGQNFFQEGDFVHGKLKVKEAYTKALNTWSKWVDKKVDRNKTKVFFAGYSASHFRGGQWNSGGSCDGETKPITNDSFLAPYPWMMRTLESVISKMKTPVVYLNITKMTGYRKDAHPSINRQPGTIRKPDMIQDCSHWCLPGVPDSWNHLLYASLLLS
ncbi:protein trichome birefringence-like 4 [Silene latifolia]|uniref:protein trichome birefringence-like 4 n=1 Tax=Silene latifolia TaxID=37657 RepID=UPI003D76D4F4